MHVAAMREMERTDVPDGSTAYVHYNDNFEEENISIHSVGNDKLRAKHG